MSHNSGPACAGLCSYSKLIQLLAELMEKAPGRGRLCSWGCCWGCHVVELAQAGPQCPPNPHVPPFPHLPPPQGTPCSLEKYCLAAQLALQGEGNSAWLWDLFLGKCKTLRMKSCFLALPRASPWAHVRLCFPET